MTRIASLASSTTIITRLLENQARLQDLELQSSTGKVSATYKGIASASQSLVNYETTRDKLETFVTNNESTDLRLKTASTVIDGIQKTITDFREALFQYESGSLTDEQRVKDVQDAAFRALSAMGVDLNTEVDGRYIFAGGRVTTQPVDLGLSSLANFQAQYDGEAVVYPPTRGAHVGTKLDLSATDLGGLTGSGTDTLTAGTAGALSGIPVGARITIANSANGNDGTYTVVSNDGTTMTISGTMTVGSSTIDINNSITNGADAAATISVDTYYSGDTASQSHRVADSRKFSLDVNAIDPAFEKAIRAMGIIAQGAFGTNGGLDQNTDRIDQAIYLINYALDITNPGSPPFGTEQSSNIGQISQDIGYQRVLIDRTNQQHKSLISFFDQKVIDTENADPLEIISKLQSEANALQAAYQAVSRVQQLSLVSYLS